MFVQPFGFIGAGKPSEWVVRNDEFAQYVVMAVPGTLATNLGMTNFYDDISSVIRGSGTNVPMKPSGSNIGSSLALIWASGSVVNSGSYNFSTNGYESSLYTSGSQNATFLPSGILSFTTQSFVIEYWVNYGPSGFTQPPFNKGGMSSPGNSPNYWDFAGWSPRYRWGYNTNFIFYTATQTAGTWYHVAYVRSAASASFYINGRRVNTPTNIGAATSINASAYHIMGINNGVNTNDGAAARFNDFRITIGSDRNYTGSSFTPPQSLIYKS